jgi:glycerophosphoryl diester phosphodiesterase
MENITLQRRSFDIFKKGHKIFVEGHRGVNREFYQNSMKSFAQAIKYGLDSMELDIWLTKDKIPVILHRGKEGQLYEHIKDVDKNLIVNNLTLEELLKLKLKGKDDQTVPTFEEVLNLCKDKIFINVEIKDPNTTETFREVIKLIEEKKMINQIAISSFHHEYYDLIKKYNDEHDEKIEFGFLYYDKSETDVFKPYKFNTNGCSMNIYQKDVTWEIVDKAHRNNIVVLVWFKMKDEENNEVYKKLFDCGIDIICCNEPLKAKQFRDNIYSKNK